MCTHGHWIKNPYTRENLYVPCNHCKACQVDKSKRYFHRILNHEADHNYFRIFLTLTYSNDFLPYIDLSDIDFDSETINVYRRKRIYSVRNRYGSRQYITPCNKPIGIIRINQFDRKYFYNSSIGELREPTRFGNDSCVGVVYNEDFHHFLMRFRVYCKRYYDIDLSHGKLSYYKISEYGPTTFRPHFHALLYFPSDFSKHYQSLRRAIIKAWPFCHPREWQTNCQIALTGQSYVSSYTVRPSSYPEFLKIRKISQRPTFSCGYGFGRTAFTAANIYNSVKQHVFTFSYQTVGKDGCSTSATASVPPYVYNRFFPKFKGFYRLNLDEIQSVLVAPSNIWRYNYKLNYTYDDYLCFVALRRNALLRYPSQIVNVLDYAVTYCDFYWRHKLYNERVLLEHVTNIYEFYDNSADLLSGHCRYIYNPAAGDIFNPKLLTPDPNKYSVRIHDEAEKCSKYDEFEKKSKINDIAYNGNIQCVTYQLNFKHFKLHKNAKYFKKSVS